MKTENVQVNTKESHPIFTDVNLTTGPNITNIAIFFVKDFLYWWYIQMPIFYLNKLERLSIVISDNLSILILLKNFFLPWKRHKSAVGYFMGITTKLFYLPIAIAIYLVIITGYIITIIAWLFLPPTAILFVLISLMFG